ncbi:outer membrane transport energization protein ExbD [Roseovarius azorensis]|uniref:Outer membrane transport energization protein ExbD n=1 Tax=Roseovarius azorensis TaxID=1287727 RepID=A0A1H7HX56_9RHOB|nr:biopolymer transporter ExbD [Roseovarius azorensis]SEK52805.1 outer membrane transport energization protein ExbD [Roseovarius azorensis]
MEFSAPRRRRPKEAIVPMINVVFLLLIFFLMSAQIPPPAPFDVTLPNATGAEVAAPADTLHIDAGGQLAFNAARGNAVYDALAARATTDTPLQIRADAALDAQVLARLLPELATRGVTMIELLTRAR